MIKINIIFLLKKYVKKLFGFNDANCDFMNKKGDKRLAYCLLGGAFSIKIENKL